MAPVRLVFSKTGRAVYISHLDLMRSMQRSIKRSHLPVWYTEGFNPRIYVMFPLPLSLGISSRCEIMDLRLNEEIPFDQVILRMNQALPPDIQVLNAAAPVHPHTDIALADYNLELYSNTPPQDLENSFSDFLGQEAIWIEKINKKKKKVQVDLKPLIQLLKLEQMKGGLCLSLRLPAGNSSLNPNAVLEAFQTASRISLERVRIERTKILCADGESFL